MKTFKQVYYLIEQDQGKELSELYKSIIEATDKFKKINAEDLKKIEEDPKGYGAKFWNKIAKIVKNIDSSISDPNSILKNEETILNDFKKELEKLHTYNSSFKSIFDRILPTAAVSAATQATPKAEATPSNEKDADFTTPVAEVPSAEEAPKAEETPSNISDESIIDYLDSKGQPSDYASRSKLAADFGIENYRGSREQNLELLGKLKSGETPTAKDSTSNTVTKSGETPKIKFNGVEQTAYVDMGGGKYIPATEDQLGDPNTQLYVKNPKRGQTEYLKPTYVKVRREGNELRRQSQFGGALGSLSNLFGDIGNTLAGKGSEGRSSSYDNYQPTADRPPARRQARN
jgi:hypothetical protein